MTSVKGSCITAPSRLANLLAALAFVAMLESGVSHAAEVPTNTWTDQTIETAFRDVLAHGDLSDIGFLGRSLGLELEVVEWEKPSNLQKESVETRAMAVGVPSYLWPYGFSYILTRIAQEGTSRINISFNIKSCPDLRRWGIDWNQPVRMSQGKSPDAGPDYEEQSLRWQQNAEGIGLERTTTSNGSCDFRLTQKTHATLSIPEPATKTPGPGTQLLEQVVDLVVAGDLRDYMTTAHILHIELTTYGKLHGHRLYDGSAIPDRVIPGTDTRFFDYSVNDTGWTNADPLVFSRRRGPRSAGLGISVDTVTNCISPESLESLMRQRHVRFRKEFQRDFGPILRTFRRGNALSIAYYLQGSCIRQFKLNQQTNFIRNPS